MVIDEDLYNALRCALARLDAIASAAESAVDNARWPPGSDPRQIQRIGHLVSAVSTAAAEAMLAVDKLIAEIH